MRYFLILILFSCSKEVDLNLVDDLIKNKKYEKALEQIGKVDSSSINNAILKRLKHKKVLAEKGQVFLKVDSLFYKQDTNGVKVELELIKKSIKRKDSLIARWYYFDYYRGLGSYSLLKSDSAVWLKNIIKALEFPSSEKNIKNSLFLDIAFYFAQKGEFVSAREWMDQSMRRLEMDSINRIELGQVYLYYMNGKFNKADSALRNISTMGNRSHWQRVRNFLSLYSDSLTMENRFRLW